MTNVVAQPVPRGGWRPLSHRRRSSRLEANLSCRYVPSSGVLARVEADPNEAVGRETTAGLARKDIVVLEADEVSHAMLGVPDANGQRRLRQSGVRSASGEDRASVSTLRCWGHSRRSWRSSSSSSSTTTHHFRHRRRWVRIRSAVAVSGPRPGWWLIAVAPMNRVIPSTCVRLVVQLPVAVPGSKVSPRCGVNVC